LVCRRVVQLPCV